VLQDNERRNLYKELRRYDTWEPPYHVESCFNHDDESGVKTSMKVRVDQDWHNISQVMLDGELCVAMLCIAHCNAESE